MLLAALLASSPVHAAAIRAIDVAEDRITLSFDDAVGSARAFSLDGPQRIAIDVGGVQGIRNVAISTAAAGGMVAATRIGRRDANTARVVFDLAEPVIVKDAEFADDGRSLVLSIAPASEKGFARSVRAKARSFFSQVGFRAAAKEQDRGSIVVPLEPASKFTPPPMPKVRGGRGTNRPLLVIDPGHGGHDPGAISVLSGRKEKDAALAIAKAIRDELVASGRVRVALTREDDRFLVLQERREIARRLKADLFISIHADSALADDAHGASIYTLSEVASDKVAARLAARENRADVLNGVNLGDATPDVSSILVDLAQRESMNMSSSFAGLMQREMAPDVPFKSTYHRFAAFAVLKAPDVPSVLLETGYMSNLDDSRFLFSKAGQRAIAKGVKNAVIAYFARRMASR